MGRLRTYRHKTKAQLLQSLEKSEAMNYRSYCVPNTPASEFLFVQGFRRSFGLVVFVERHSWGRNHFAIYRFVRARAVISVIDGVCKVYFMRKVTRTGRMIILKPIIEQDTDLKKLIKQVEADQVQACLEIYGNYVLKTKGNVPFHEWYEKDSKYK